MTDREKCESCIHAKPFGGENDNRCGAWECEYINRKEAIAMWNDSKWRPISEKPDAGQMGKDYLVYTEFGIGIATYFPNDKWNGYDVMGDGFSGDIILAWMPLPAPWKGEYINRKEAIEVYKAYKDIVRCKDCKHYDTESRTFPCCTDIFGAVRYMEADGFCSKGERKGE